MRPVEIPTSAPKPNLFVIVRREEKGREGEEEEDRYPSAKRVEALWKTQALSTSRRNFSAVSPFSVIMDSVCALKER
jgi:hypothetical protein